MPSLFLVWALLLLCSQIFAERDQVPSEAPTNLTLLEIKGRQVVIEWEPVSPETVRGTFRGYLVRTWNHVGSQVYAFPPEITRVNVEYFPFSKNFITVSARNEKYVGPPSEAIGFDAPQIAPNLPYVLNAFHLSNKSVLLQWSKPTQPNGILLGYKIYCAILNTTSSNEVIETHQVSHEIYDPDKLQAKLTGMQQGVRYRIGIAAFNCAGESEKKTTEITLEPHIPSEPFPPKFVYKIGYKTVDIEEACDDDHTTNLFTVPPTTTQSNTIEANPPAPQSEEDENKRCRVDCMVLWMPDVRNSPGENFQVKYRQRGDKDFQVTEPEISEDFIILHDFNACKNYELVLTAIDGNYTTDSRVLITPTKIV